MTNGSCRCGTAHRDRPRPVDAIVHIVAGTVPPSTSGRCPRKEGQVQEGEFAPHARRAAPGRCGRGEGGGLDDGPSSQFGAGLLTSPKRQDRRSPASRGAGRPAVDFVDCQQWKRFRRGHVLSKDACGSWVMESVYPLRTGLAHGTRAGLSCTLAPVPPAAAMGLSY